MKAMILAAGRGERLRPLTDHTPKPLVCVHGQPLIVYHLKALRAAGIRHIVINVAHLGAQIEQTLGDGRTWDCQIQWSRETIALETAGGIAQARPLLGETPFVLINADVFTDLDYTQLVDAARALHHTSLLGHLVLVPNPSFHPQGDFSLRGSTVGNLSSTDTHTAADHNSYTYAGLAALSLQLFDGITAGSRAALAPRLRAAAAQRQLLGSVHTGLWDDVGTLERLHALNGTSP